MASLMESSAGNRDLPPLTDAQRQELERRLADLDAHPYALSFWEEVEARLLKKLLG